MEENKEKKSINLKEFVDNEDLNVYCRELQEDTHLTNSNLREKSLMVSALRVKWLNYYMKEKENLKRLNTCKDKILKDKLKSKNFQDSVLKMKNEEMLSENDENMIRIKAMQERVKTNIDFLERVQNIMSEFVWDIKNAIEHYKLERI